MSRVADAFLVLIGKADIAHPVELPELVASLFAGAEDSLRIEEQRIEHMLTDALASLANAVHAVLTERDSDHAAVAQAQADRDAAQAQVADLQKQLSDAESQINAMVAQLNPPAADPTA